MKSGSRRQA